METKQLSWTRDEIILACDLVRQNNWRSLSSDDARVIELSNLLQLLPLHPKELRGGKFRNANGVRRKSVDIATRHPDYTGKPTNGNVLDGVVLWDFLDYPKQMQFAAALIRKGAQSGFPDGSLASFDDEFELSVKEGSLLARVHLSRERDKGLRTRKLAQFAKENSELTCEACGFNFEQVYGDRGKGYIECHHVVPLHVSGVTKTRLRDLVLLCSNCHKIVHRKSPWLTFAELRDLIVSSRT